MIVAGRLVLDDRIVSGRISVAAGLIESVEEETASAEAGGPFVLPGFVDVHVHGFGGHSAMGSAADLDGMARALLARGVTSFLPTAVTAPLDELRGFAERVRDWMPRARRDGTEPLGFNIEGPFISAERRGAHDPRHIVAPADVDRARLEPLLDGLRLITVAPETAGAPELIAWLRGRGVAVSIGHSAATLTQARAGYAAGATSTTHLFNAMSGLDHRSPGLAAAALADDEAYVELIADGHHVDRALWPIVMRTKPRDRLLLVSDAVAVAGTEAERGEIGGLPVEVADGRLVLAGSQTLAGSLIALDAALRAMVAAGAPLADAAAAAAANPLAMLGITDRGRLAARQRADIVELDDRLNVRRVMRAGEWLVSR
ncbi:N-acetylglucosamine-6-phosphate deacetylase [soil metagenome]